MNHPKLYKKFVRLSAVDLLNLVGPRIQKQDTPSDTPDSLSITPGERLALTLRFLAKGERFMALQYLFRIPQTTIFRIIPNVCDGIYATLKDLHMKVVLKPP